MAHVKKDKVNKKKKRAPKVHLVFDADKRREFLTGFHKRKLQRKKHAQECLAKDLKEERKRLKSEAKESYKKLVVSHRPIPELEHLLADEYEDADVSVKVVELSTNEIAERNNWIGANKPKYDTDGSSGDDDAEEEKEAVPGMELKRKPPVKKPKKVEVRAEFKTERDVKKVLKKQATRNVQKSRVFQMKGKIESRKQRKQSVRMKNERMKVLDKKGKGRGRKSKG